MKKIGVLVTGVLRTAHCWVDGVEVLIAYDGKVVRQGIHQVPSGAFDVNWFLAGWPDNAFRIEIYDLGFEEMLDDDLGMEAPLLERIEGRLNHKGVSQGVLTLSGL